MNRRRIEFGKYPLPENFGVRTGLLNLNWIPQVGDVWLFDDVNFQTIVTSVSPPSRLVYSSSTSTTEDFTYLLGMLEWVNNQEKTIMHTIVYRKVTNYNKGKVTGTYWSYQPANIYPYAASTKAVAYYYYR